MFTQIHGQVERHHQNLKVSILLRHLRILHAFFTKTKNIKGEILNVINLSRINRGYCFGSSKMEETKIIKHVQDITNVFLKPRFAGNQNCSLGQCTYCFVYVVLFNIIPSTLFKGPTQN
jgi:hypothetical protein